MRVANSRSGRGGVTIGTKLLLVSGQEHSIGFIARPRCLNTKFYSKFYLKIHDDILIPSSAQLSSAQHGREGAMCFLAPPQ